MIWVWSSEDDEIMKKISVRVPCELYARIIFLVEKGYFSSVSELVREAIIEYLKEELSTLKEFSH